MSWVLLILLSAAGLGFYDVCKKHAVHANAVMPVLLLATLTGTIAVAGTLAARGELAGTFTVTWLDWWRLLLKSTIVTASWTCAYYAMRALPISIAAPIRGSQPMWTLVGALLIFGERPNGLQWAGIVTIFAGYYAFSVVGKQEGIHFHRHKGVWLIVLATMLGAASGLYDKYLLQPAGLKPATVQLWFQVDLVVLIGATLAMQRGLGLSRTAFEWRWSIPAVGLLLVGSDILYFMALHEPGAMISILSPIRRSSAIIAFLVGGAIYRDRNRLQKSWALALVAAGVVLLCFR